MRVLSSRFERTSRLERARDCNRLEGPAEDMGREEAGDGVGDVRGDERAFTRGVATCGPRPAGLSNLLIAARRGALTDESPVSGLRDA